MRYLRCSEVSEVAFPVPYSKVFPDIESGVYGPPRPWGARTSQGLVGLRQPRSSDSSSNGPAVRTLMCVPSAPDAQIRFFFSSEFERPIHFQVSPSSNGQDRVRTANLRVRTATLRVRTARFPLGFEFERLPSEFEWPPSSNGQIMPKPSIRTIKVASSNGQN